MDWIRMIERNKRIKLTTKYAMSFLGTPYIWGGDDFSGMDCSGRIVEISKMHNWIKESDDYTAEGLWYLPLFKNKKVSKPSEGCFVFYYNISITKIIHVEYCLNNEFAIGPSGGNSKVKTVADAIKYNAFTKIRKIQRGRPITGYINPFIK